MAGSCRDLSNCPNCALPKPLDQGNTGACTAHAAAVAVAYMACREGREAFVPSALWSYYHARKRGDGISFDPNVDGGTTVEEMLSSMAKDGMVREEDLAWNSAAVSTPPSPFLVPALWVHSYRRVRARNVVEELRRGHPVCFVMNITDSMNHWANNPSATFGVVPVPADDERVVEVHAMCAVGYNRDAAGGVIMARNSWGKDWGWYGGNMLVPYALLNSHCSQFFVVDALSTSRPAASIARPLLVAAAAAAITAALLSQ